MEKKSNDTKNIPQVAKMTEAMERVVESLKGSGLKAEDLNTVRTDLEYLMGAFKVTDIQAVLFATIVGAGSDTYITSRNIAEQLGISSFRMLCLYKDLHELERKDFIIENRTPKEGFCYRLTENAVQSLQDGTCPASPAPESLTTTDIINRMNKEFKESSNFEVKNAKILSACNQLFANNADNEFVRKCKDFGIANLKSGDRIAAFYILQRFVTSGEDIFEQDDLNALMDGSYDPERDEIDDFLEDNSDLFSIGLVEYADSDSCKYENALVLTDMAKEKLFSGISHQRKAKKVKNSIPSDELIRSEDIKERKLFFNQRETEQINKLTLLLQEENFCKVKERLESTGLAGGFTALFYGTPGTGKTAAIYELARRSGRDIWFVDQSKLRSKWHGESEKALRSMFRDYREAVRNSEICPILALNECDSLMYKRMDEVESSNDQLNNSMVNIILNELDSFEGILIATSNLAKGMDPAFERRMLFKICFNRPDLQTRSRIWRVKMKNMDQESANLLSKNFSFSGAQIENVARKASIEYVLYGDEPSFDSLKNLCEEELLNPEASRKKVGF